MSETQADIHNSEAGKIVASIVRPPLEAGGSATDVLVLLESVIVGVALTVIKLGGDEKVLDVVVERARERLAELRLKGIKTEGNG